MTDKFGPKAPPGIPINIFKKLASAQGTMGRGKGISFPFPSSPVGSIFPLPRPHSPLIYHTTQRVPCEAEREREREAEEVANSESSYSSLCKRARNQSRNTPRKCFWDCQWEELFSYWPIFSLSLVTVPEVLTRVNSSQFRFCVSSQGEPWRAGSTVLYYLLTRDCQKIVQGTGVVTICATVQRMMTVLIAKH